MKTGMIIAALSLTTPQAFAAGFALNTQSAESLGAATAGAPASRATPGNAYFNPASIVGIDGVEGSLSVVGVFVDSQYETASGALLGAFPVPGAASGESVIGDGVFPTGAIAARISDRLFIGLSVNAPFGFDSSYADDSVIRYHGTASEIITAAFTPIIGLALGDNWAIAGGPRIEYMNVDLDGAIDAAGIATASLIPGFVPGTDDVFFEIGADNFAVGYVAGIQGSLAPNIHVGASFTSKIQHDFSGDATFDTASSIAGQTLGVAAGLFQDTGVSAGLTAPANIQFGTAIDVTPSFTLLASATLTRWSRFQDVTIVFDNPAQPPELLTQNWNDAWAWSLGAEADLSPATQGRFGVMIEETPVNDAFASPRIPDGDRLWVAAGLSHRITGRSEFHVAASYVLIEDRPINQPATLPENLFRGSLLTNVSLNSVVVGAGVDISF